MLPELPEDDRHDDRAIARLFAGVRPTPRPERRESLLLVLSAATLLGSIAAGACSSDGLCAETATCPPTIPDAKSDPETSSPEDDGSSDAADGGDAADVSIVDDHTYDRADQTDTNAAADVSEGGDGSGNDAANADRSATNDAGDAIDAVADSASDAGPDAPTCDLDAGRSPTENPCIVNERYGIFVSPTGSDATGAGTRSAPFRTINRGLQAAKTETKRVFVCDNGSGYADPITIDATFDGLALYGGFDCAGWMLAANARTRVRPPAGSALTINGLTAGVVVDSFDLQSADAATGASSIAVRVQASQQVAFRRTRIVAGKGGSGAQGADGARGADGDPLGPDHRGRAAMCNTSTTSQAGGAASSSACGSKGGEGGGCDSLLVIGYPGYAGTPMQGVDPPDQQNGGTICIADCHGHRGSDGVVGGVGSASTQSGTMTAAGYTSAPPGGDGTPGHVAQGGGGGAGTVSEYMTNGCVGATGGAGGLGGCGGGAGKGGSAGGASIALLSWTSGIILDGCSLESADGGPGGNGGNGKLGGIGGEGATGGDRYNEGGVAIFAGGNGGWGGNGGLGGAGAGGNGGPSYGIVYAGGRPSQVGGTTVVRGAGGAKGIGGLSGVPDLPDGGLADSGGPDGASTPDAGNVRAPDGLPGEAAYELAVP